MDFPKIELHHHLDGAIRTSTLWEIYNHTQYQGEYAGLYTEETFPEHVTLEEGCSLAGFLEKFRLILDLFICLEQDQRIAYFERIGKEIVQDQVRVGGGYLETRFCPFSVFLSSDVNVELREEDMVVAKEITLAIVRGLQAGCDEERANGARVAVNVLLCSLWDHPEWTMGVVELANDLRVDSVPGQVICRVVGVDIAGDEEGDILDEHKVAFQRAHELGIGITAHYGLPHRALEVVVNELKASRVGHGYHISRSDEMMQFVKENNIHIENKITPGLKLGNYHLEKLVSVPLLIENNVSISISTDDPTIKQIDLLDEYETLKKALLARNHDESDIYDIFKKIQKDALNHCFISDEEKAIVLSWLN
eukprot:TRINITY_DN7869_c0_g1_i1.p1 TRINITY_DN7869_c0_g1~~TRINITY_DN7869_c0_g1_i1.p1  ORF type:complete len:379 (+),score=86.00 TRINITY_DN7869_c0_g1_i1:43-1137(+)